MKGLNKVTLIGNLGKDPEISTLEGDITLAKFTLATNESYKDQNGNTQTITDWHNIVAWRNMAEKVGKYLHKGSHIYMEGKIKTRSYEDKDGTKRYVTEIIADSFIMLDKSTSSANAEIDAIKTE
ncbi:MAG: single-stranded DNA-binding protein [Cytophagales bacterium]